MTRTIRSWAEHMEFALYDPECGFFARSPVGQAFATAPHISPVFAACIARLLERTGGDTVLELACGDGTLAAQIARSAPALAARTRYLGVDRDAAALQAFAARGSLGFRDVRLASNLDDIEPIRGLIFANELFDNVPFERIRRRGDAFVAVAVEERDATFVEVEQPVTVTVLAAAGCLPEEGEERTVSPDARALLRAMADRLEAGAIVVLDYGHVPGEAPEPVRGYRAHERVDPLAVPPGECDITGPADIAALIAEGQAAGLEVTHRRQADLLRDLGCESFLLDLDRQRVTAEEAGDHRRALRIWEARRDASLLVDPRHLGSFHALEMRRTG